VRQNVAATYEKTDGASVNIRANKGDLNGYYLNKDYLYVLMEPDTMNDLDFDKWVITVIS
jgi:hypothetical protein